MYHRIELYITEVYVVSHLPPLLLLYQRDLDQESVWDPESTPVIYEHAAASHNPPEQHIQQHKIIMRYFTILFKLKIMAMNVQYRERYSQKPLLLTYQEQP